MEQSSFSLAMCLLGNFIGVCILFQFLNVFFPKGTKWERSLQAGAFAAYFILSSLESFVWKCSPLILLATSILSIFLITLLYRGTWKMRIISTALVMGLNIILEDLAYRILITLGTEYVLALILAVTNLLLFMCMMVARKIASMKQGESIPFSEWLAIVLVPVISIFFSAIVLDQCKDEAAAFLGGMCVLILNLVIFYLLEHLMQLQRQKFEVSLLEQENKAYANQLNEMSAAYRNMQSIRHDLKNHLLVLHEMSVKEDFSDLDKYIADLDCVVRESEPIVKTGNLVIDSLLNLKLHAIQSAFHIEPKIEIAISKDLTLEKYDACVILGNLLDNAYEALEHCENRWLEVSLHEHLGTLHISISNTYDGKISKKGEMLLTTKENKEQHGIGLNNVRKVVEKYHGEMDCHHTDDIFTVEILLYL